MSCMRACTVRKCHCSPTDGYDAPVQAAEEAGEAISTEAAAEEGPAKPSKAARGGGGEAPPEDPAKYPSKEAIGPFCAHPLAPSCFGAHGDAARLHPRPHIAGPARLHATTHADHRCHVARPHAGWLPDPA